MIVKVTLECTGCVQNRVNNKKKKKSAGIYRYLTQKNPKNTPSPLELRKFCPYCNYRARREVPTSSATSSTFSLEDFPYHLYPYRRGRQ